ncbi:unnamed protein product [Porites lobata]|uniref:Uncharacterized protein n=1 Tax=Porites lobata TaxID=104759 RepID=A0ABN8RHJ3_9CNID|nr:unnamed protein product [Porites lobata]
MADNKLPHSSPRTREYPDDPKREVLEAAIWGDAELLNEVLGELNSAERISVLAVHKYPQHFSFLSAFPYHLQTTPLINAVENENLDCLKVLLKYKADIEGLGDLCFLNRRTPYFHWQLCTPLCVAAAYGNLDILSFLLENGADINAAIRTGGLTPLMLAVQKYHSNAVNYLLEQGADVNLQDMAGYTALHTAAACGNYNALRSLIYYGADVNARNRFNRTPLMLACQVVNKEAINNFINEHDHKKVYVRRSLCHFIRSNRNSFDAVTFLIDQGADVNLQDNNGHSALHHAVADCFYDKFSFKWLIVSEAHVTSDDYCPCNLVTSCQDDNVNVVDCLVQNEANIVDLQDEDGETALFFAVRSNWTSFGILSSLVTKGANLNTSRNDKRTPLMEASSKNDEKQVTWLIEHGADVNLQDEDDGDTALHFACNSDHASLEILSCLIENGASINACTDCKITPLMMAVQNCHKYVVSYLIEHGANVDLQDEDGDTALHYVAYQESRVDKTETFLTLSTAGASCLCKNSKGLTPLLVASGQGLTEVVESLIQQPEMTKEQRIDALELLGASLALEDGVAVEEGFVFIKRGMIERFADPSNPLLKCQMEPVEAYQNRKESQTLEELVQVEDDEDAVIMESLVVRERILGRNIEDLLEPIRFIASYYEDDDFPTSARLYRHAMKIAQHCSQSAVCDLSNITSVLENWLESDLPKDDAFIELLDQTFIDHNHEILQRNLTEKQEQSLFDSLLRLVKMMGQFNCCEEEEPSNAAILLKTICRSNPRDGDMNTLLHQVVRSHCGSPSHLYLEAVKFLLNAGFSANSINTRGETPLHLAVTLCPGDENIHLLTEMLEVLFNGGAHHDFVNHHGKTPMDMAETDEARIILSARRKLELKCISAKAVKKFGIPYLGVVPKTLEKYISMH